MYALCASQLKIRLSNPYLAFAKIQKRTRELLVSRLSQNKSITSMMTQFTVNQAEQHLQPCATCADCPMFLDFQGTRNRGWCSAFERMARTYHPRTNSCELAIKEYQEKNPVEVAVTLCSHELEIDEDEGFSYPKEERVISFFVEEVSKKAVYQAFEAHQSQFPGFYIADYRRCYPDAEF